MNYSSLSENTTPEIKRGGGDEIHNTVHNKNIHSINAHTHDKSNTISSLFERVA